MAEDYGQKLNIANQIARQEVTNDAKFKFTPQFQQQKEIDMRAKRYAKSLSLAQLNSKLKNLPSALSGKNVKKYGYESMGLEISKENRNRMQREFQNAQRNLDKATQEDIKKRAEGRYIAQNDATNVKPKIQTNESGSFVADSAKNNNDNSSLKISAPYNKKSKISPEEKEAAREFLVQYLQQINESECKTFNSYTDTSIFDGKEGAMEIQELWNKGVDALKLPTDWNITDRTYMSNYLNSEAKQISDLKVFNDLEKNAKNKNYDFGKQFEEKYKEHFGKDVDYVTILNYMKASEKYKTQGGKNVFTNHEFKDANKNLTKMLSSITKEEHLTKWINKTEAAGGLVDLAFSIELMAATGGSSAIASASQMAAKGATTLAKDALVKTTLNPETVDALAQFSGILSAQTMGSGLNGLAFQTTKVLSALHDGKISKEELNNISQSAASLTKFGFVGGGFSTPVAMKIAEGTTKLMNSTPIINSVIKASTLAGKEVALSDILNSLGKNAETLSKVTKFGTEFVANTGYLALDDGTSFTDAAKNLAQMDGVSKIVAAFMGGKFSKNFTPQDLKRAKNSFDGITVKVANIDGKRGYEIKDKDGNTYKVTNEKELMSFVQMRTFLSTIESHKPASTNNTQAQNKVKREQNVKHAKVMSLTDENGKVDARAEVETKTEVRELTDAEFETIKADVNKKIDKFPEIKEKLNKNILNKFNVQFLEVLLDNNLLDNQSVKNSLLETMHKIDSQEELSAKTRLIDTLIKYPTFLEIPSVKMQLGGIIHWTDSQEEASGKIRLIDTLIKHPAFLEIPRVKETIGIILKLTRDYSEAYARTILIEDMEKNNFLDIIKNPENIMKYFRNAESIININLTLPYVKDLKLKQKISEAYNNQKYEEAEKLIDIYNTFNGNYSTFKTQDGTNSDISKFSKFMKETYPAKYKKLCANGNESQWKEYIKKLYHSDTSLKKDFQNDAKLFNLREYLKDNPNSEMSEYLYNEYYLKNCEAPKEIIAKLKEINAKYKVKILLTSDLNNAKESLQVIDEELNKWQIASNGQAKMPPVIDFSKIKSKWYDNESAYGQGKSAACCESGNNGAIAFGKMTPKIIRYALRHELTHTNDLKHGRNIDPKYNIDEIMPKKTEKNSNGKEIEVPDIDKCKYTEEFRHAGIPEWQIKYAYNNTQEFIAVASEGDMSKYSPEFKQILIDFGMPEWEFNLKQ